MAIDRAYVKENNAERERLRALVTCLSDQELARPVSAGWTVAGVLGHLAFWDQRIVVLVERWRRDGAAAVPPSFDQGPHVDWINDAAKPLLMAVPPRRAAEVTLAIAEAVDRAVETLPDDFVTRNQAAGNVLNLVRAEHRREHLDEIEQALRR
ncbi:MAG: DinB family protein [Candidatus Rokuibacteriota bacterium]